MMQNAANNSDSRITLAGVSKSYLKQVVFSNFNLEVSAGTVALVLGANGSGKTTLLRMCVGLSRADSGKIVIDGKKPSLASIGYCGHALMLYSNLTVKEHILLAISLQSLPVVCDEILHEWNLANSSNKRVCDLSRGTQFRLSLALCFLHSPENVFLDEPTSSLDDQILKLLSDKILKSAKSGTVLMATHDIERVKHLANRVIVINQGTISLDTGLVVQAPGKIPEKIEQAFGFYRELNR